MPRSRSTATALTGLLAAVAAVAGCGGETTYRTDRPILRISLDEYRIVPQDIVVKPGRMKFVVRNTGRLTHNLVVQIPEGPNGKPWEVGKTVRTLQPGETGEPFKLTLLPGEYRLVCSIANHDDLGQFGKLEVR